MGYSPRFRVVLNSLKQNPKVLTLLADDIPFFWVYLPFTKFHIFYSYKLDEMPTNYHCVGEPALFAMPSIDNLNGMSLFIIWLK